MLRITTEETDGWTMFRLEGKLKGDWVRELEHCWTSALVGGLERQCSIELSNVDFIDEGGRALLSRMVSQGARLEAQSNLIMSSLIEEIVHGPNARSKQSQCR